MLAGVSLTDHFELRALRMVAFQVVVALVVLVYGLVSPSLGSHLLWPGLAMLLWWGALAWLTLTRPWSAGFSAVVVAGEHQEGRWFQRRQEWWESGVLIGVTLGLARLFFDVLGDVKDDLRAWAEESGRPLEWFYEDLARKAFEADPYGYELVSGANAFGTMVAPAFLIFVLWFVLPR